ITLERRGFGVEDVWFSPAGDRLLILTRNDDLHQFHLDGAAPPDRLDVLATNCTYMLSGDAILAGGGSLRVIAPDLSLEYGRFGVDIGTVERMALSPDGSYLVSSHNAHSY